MSRDRAADASAHRTRPCLDRVPVRAVRSNDRAEGLGHEIRDYDPNGGTGKF
jgi:hypothetical protein